MKSIRIEIKSVSEKILFSYECIGNTIKKTVERAIKELVDLRSANLRSADLRYANLGYADLRYANLSHANLSLAYGLTPDSIHIQQTRILPEGDIIGYKKCVGNKIVKLLIPKDAKRSHAFGRKCRAEYAEVLEISEGNVAYSHHDGVFRYEVGKVVKPKDPFSEDWKVECGSGIHFFITRAEAEAY